MCCAGVGVCITQCEHSLIRFDSIATRMREGHAMLARCTYMYTFWMLHFRNIARLGSQTGSLGKNRNKALLQVLVVGAVGAGWESGNG
jgi:ferredoxin